jgi:PKD repeat protein
MPIRPTILGVAFTGLMLLAACSSNLHPADTPPHLEHVGWVIDGVAPMYVTAPGKTSTISVSFRGSQPATTSWDFGGGATPNTSSAESVALTVPTPGVYHCSVSVTNAFGSDSMLFDMQVTLPPLPTIDYVVLEPSSPRTGADVTFDADGYDPTVNIFGLLTASYSWDFGGGAQPSSSTESFLTTKALAPGTYHGSVTATNATGSTTKEFEYTVGP